MKKKRLHAFVMSITPFDEHGRLDEPALRRHFRRLLDGGVSVYVASSATGEAFSMTPDEIDRVHAIAVEEFQGKTVVRAGGFEPRRVEDMIEFVKRASAFGLDAIHVSKMEMGHGSRPTTRELEKYYSTVLESTSHRLVLSSYEAMGSATSLDLVERLVDRYPHIVGFFYGGTDMRYLTEMIRRIGDRVEVHCTGPFNAITTLTLGGNGFMGHEGNLYPALFASVVSAFEAKDHDRMNDAFTKVMGIHAIHYRYGGVLRAMKPLLNALGLPGGTVRLPRLAITPEELEDVLESTLNLGIAGLPQPISPRPKF